MSPNSEISCHSRTVGPLRQLFALASGATAWMIHLLGASVLVPAACEHGVGWSIDALTAATALVCGAGIVVSLQLFRGNNHGRDDDPAGVGFVGYIALMSNLISLALIVGEGAMHWFVEVCA